jgi:cytochrome oxidase assembly protein ShyY1
VQGIIEIEGILRQGETTSALAAATNVPEKNEWYSIDLDQMSSFSGTSKTLIELVAGNSAS